MHGPTATGSTQVCVDLSDEIGHHCVPDGKPRRCSDAVIGKPGPKTPGTLRATTSALGEQAKYLAPKLGWVTWPSHLNLLM